MGIRPETIQWSLLPEYKNHQWHSRIRVPGQKERPCKDPIKTVLDALGMGVRRICIQAARGVGKAQPLDSVVLTQRGWVKIRDLVITDSVAGRDGSLHLLNGIYHQGFRPVVRVTFSDESSTLCDTEHVWSVFREGTKGGPSDVLAKDLTTDHYIPFVQPVDLPEVPLPIDPYVLGMILGDGSMRRPGAVLISSADKQCLDEIQCRLGDEYSLEKDNNSRKYDYKIKDLSNLVARGGSAKGSSNRLKRAIENMGMSAAYSHEKFIPGAYMTASKNQRLDLLRGLMDSDGTVDKRGVAVFTSTSKDLASGVLALARSLGGYGVMRSKDGGYYSTKYQKHMQGRVAYNISVSISDNPFLLKRKKDLYRPPKIKKRRRVVSVEPIMDMECACISTSASDHLYVTNDYIVTHNTFIGGRAVAPWFISVYPGASRIFTFASREDQLKVGLWKELELTKPLIKKEYPNSEWGVLQVFMNPTGGDEAREAWSIRGLTASIKAGEESSTKVSGIHDAHMLFILEELQGYDPAVFKSLDRTSQGRNNLILAYGNPKGETEELHRFATHPSTLTIRMSAMDHPNIVLNDPDFIPGAVSHYFIESLLLEPEINGDKMHPVFLAEVHGITPIATGDCLFHVKTLEVIRDKHAPKDENGRREWKMPPVIEHTNHDKYEGDMIVCEGETVIRFGPEATHFDRYFISADVAGANVTGDWNFGIVGDRYTGMINAVVRMRCIGEEFIDELIRLGTMFSVKDPRHNFHALNDALISYEVNGVGQLHRNQKIRNYPHIYRRINPDATNPRDQKIYGWATTGGKAGTRSAMIDAGRQWGLSLLHNPDVVWYEPLFDDMKAFCFDKKAGRYQAVSGFLDDGVMAVFQYLVIDEEQSVKGRPPVPFTKQQLDSMKPGVTAAPVDRNTVVKSKKTYAITSSPRSFKRRF